jgi:hypothetical protein
VINLLREANSFLGFATFFGLCYRYPQALAGVSSKRLFIALSLFPIGVAFGSVYALAHDFPPAPTAPYFFVAYVALGVVLVWWPKQFSPGSQEHP